MFDEIFESCSTVCDGCFAAKCNGKSRQDGRFAGSVVSDNEVDLVAQLDFKTGMALALASLPLTMKETTMKLNSSMDLRTSLDVF